jgi:hypothetical protein
MVAPMQAIKSLHNATILIAVCALFHWATAQNDTQNGLKTGSEESAKPGQSLAQRASQQLRDQANQCIPANTFNELPTAIAGTQTDAYGKTSVALGSYERISPDGRFVLRSFSGARLGQVSLIELSASGEPVAAYQTPLSNEAFPVQGSWRYLVDVNGDHYSFSSILRNNTMGKERNKPLFRGGMRGFYAAAAELPFNPATDKPGQVRIRSMSWPNPSGNAETQGEGALVARTLTIDTAQQRIVFDTGAQRLCGQRLAEDGPLYALPMISVDGQEFAALPQTPINKAGQAGEQTMRIFSFGKDGASCDSRAMFSFSSGKTIFGFAHSSGHADLAYEYRGQVWWVSRGTGMWDMGGEQGKDQGSGQRFNLAPYYDNPRTQLLASAFPGITQDGRVIYGATLKDCPTDATKPCVDKAGYVTSDPYQSNAYQQFLRQVKGPARRQCITHGDVARVRANFSSMHGLTTP